MRPSHSPKKANPMTWYFVTLETQSKAPLLDNVVLRTRVEQSWAAAMRGPDPLYSAEFAVNSRALHALVRVQAGPRPPEEVLAEGLDAFMAMEGPALWSPQPRLRRLRDAGELRDLRDFIVQKMLGGEEFGIG
jgi:hypothetical protein